MVGLGFRKDSDSSSSVQPGFQPSFASGALQLAGGIEIVPVLQLALDPLAYIGSSEWAARNSDTLKLLQLLPPVRQVGVQFLNDMGGDRPDVSEDAPKEARMLACLGELRKLLRGRHPAPSDLLCAKNLHYSGVWSTYPK